jgi:glutamate dehydrogenase (NADP+)
MSDSAGFILDRDGINSDKLEWIKQLKNVRRGRIREYAEHFGCEYHEGKRPWAVDGAQCAFPSATQNEVDLTDARRLVSNGVSVVSEGANMPTNPEGVEYFIQQKILYGPGKAANAGGVATSGLEMSQNAGHEYWTREEVDQRLLSIMVNIHRNCRETAEAYGTPGNYVNGANIAGFLKVARAMMDQGVV